VSSGVSAQVITLNEAENIAVCLSAIQASQPSEILVIDGGSSDETVEIARSYGATVLTPGRLGRGASRALGYNSTDLPYVAMIDADDVIDADWIVRMRDELVAGNYSALQSGLRVLAPRTFWERGWNEYFIESIPPSTDTIMVGHPAIYRTHDLQAARADIGHENEDTQLSIDFVNRGLRQGISPSFSYRVVPSGAVENIAKWRGYGRGYRALVRKHPDRAQAIWRHMLFTIPIVRGWRPVSRGRFGQPVFAAVMGGSILWGYLRGR
jgi:glycosyltransferase involved in cell wall biosynthesis